MIIDSKTPPPRISTSPGFFKCKFCDQSEVCHLGVAPDRNCRTCTYSDVRDAGTWVCLLDHCSDCGGVQANTPSGMVCENGHGGADSGCRVLSQQDQLSGCEKYLLNQLINAK